MTQKIRIAGPPGTGKTTKLVQIYYEHIVENKDRSQNSTACITIQPYDLFPYPKVNVRY